MAGVQSEPRLAYMTTTAKTYTFPVDVRWIAGRLTRATATGKPDLAVATPPEFKKGIPGVWSPEDLLVASAAACFAVTLLAVAERREVPVHSLHVAGRGRVGQRPEGSFGFTEIELGVQLETFPGHEDEARDAAEAAERGCLIAASLDVPIRLELEVSAVPLAAAR